MRVLIADDHEDIAHMVGECVKSVGVVDYDIVIDSEELYDKLCNNRYDIAFIDVLMPKENGPKVVERIKSENRLNVNRIIYMTGYTGDCVVKGEVIYKPFSIAKIFEILNA